MNTDKISSELYHDLLQLLGIPNDTQREDVAVAYLDEGEFIDFIPEYRDDSYHVTASNDHGDSGSCSFDDYDTALKFIDAMILLAKADELAGGNQ